MSHKEPLTSADALGSPATPGTDPLADTRPLISQETPKGLDRRRFLMRSAVGGAAAVMTGCSGSPGERTARAAETSAAPPAPATAASTPPLAADLYVVMRE